MEIYCFGQIYLEKGCLYLMQFFEIIIMYGAGQWTIKIFIYFMKDAFRHNNQMHCMDFVLVWI